MYILFSSSSLPFDVSVKPTGDGNKYKLVISAREEGAQFKGIVVEGAR